MLPTTPQQTIGPFFRFALPYPGDCELVAPGTVGAVRIAGTVFDGAGEPIPDALVEIWQAAPDGSVPRAEGSLRRDGLTFTGFGRAETDAGGGFHFVTLEPGSVDGGLPFIAVAVYARGLLRRQFTRAYLPVDDAAAGGDPLLGQLGPQDRQSLMLRPEGNGYRFDIHLQGPHETTFLDFGDAPRE